MVCEGESVKFAFIAEMDGENDCKPREEKFPVMFIEPVTDDYPGPSPHAFTGRPPDERTTRSRA